MQQKKTKPSKLSSPPSTIPIAFRMETHLHANLRPYADKGRRTIAAQLNLVVEEWLAQQKPIAPTTISPAALDQPVPKVFQKAPVRAPAPTDKMAEIAYGDEGFEGSDPKRLLAGTKVTI